MPGPIRLNDPTTSCGSVVSSKLGAFATIDGKPIIVRGDMAACPLHNGVFPFFEADDSTTFEGFGVVLEGHKLACGCSAISTVSLAFDVTPTSLQSLGSSSRAKEKLKNAGSIGADLAAEYVKDSGPFSGRFRLLDESTGQPVVERSIVLETASGRRIECVTDDDGYTPWIESEEEEGMSMRLNKEDTA
ncbi:PAAR domain-containing protein [Xanthomonas cerealis]|uniref:PAAR domain-containing protein n=1 Tax=Xanthomonas cerealis TaxID=3390025 RepID=UPI0009B863CA|nr:PAAR domain-containing protein [Xanthomonas translucens]UKE48149.1 PAAR domain-containing protein [Xanthomonas translucens pv. cerealis]